MTLNEIWQMSYDDYVQYLLKKYGPATKDYYYINKNGNLSKNKITRTSEGLECHHIDEDKYILLATLEEAKRHFETQKANRLCYADKIEHLLLHIKITTENCYDYCGKKYCEMTEKEIEKFENSERNLFGFGCGCRYIIGNINSLYQTPPDINTIANNSKWLCNMYNKIENNFDAYIEILCRIMKIMIEAEDPKDYIFKIIFATDNYYNSNIAPKKILEAFSKRLENYIEQDFNFD